MAAKLLLIAALSFGSSLALDVTPLQKVVQMLDGVLAKGKAEKHAEDVEFAKFHEWCDQTRTEKETSIKELGEEIMQLAADIDAAEADAEQLSEEIGELEKEIASLTSELEKATAARKKEKKDYEAAHLDVSESIDAVARAIQVLKQRDHDVPQSLAQVAQSKFIDDKAKAVITSFLALGSDSEAGAPEANAYEFQSGGVIDLLAKLKLKFEDQKLALEKAEMNSNANYEVLAQQLTDDIKADTASMDKKTAMKAKRLSDAAKAKGDKEVAETSKAEDEKTLSDTNAECKETSEDFENNQVTRAAEIKAVEKAIEILSSDAVKGNAEEYLPKFVQKSGPVLAQLRAGASPEVAQRVAEFLQARAKLFGSRYLALAATKAQEDPFGKVKKMIKDLIVKLMEQANAEADQHAYCETELATNKQTREIKSSEVDELTASLEEEQALVERLTTEIAALSESIAEIKASQAAATKIRMESKATNAATVEDAKEAQDAVQRAITVLKDFYASAADLALVQGKDGMAVGVGLKEQMKQAALPTYRGMQDTSTGIFGMLEVVLSDFARLESETSASEDAQQTAYDKMMDETNEDVAVKETEMNHKTNSKDQAVENVNSLQKNLKMTQDELDKALDYYDKLKAECVDTGLSYAERKKMREEEVVSLQEALKMLNGEDIAA